MIDQMAVLRAVRKRVIEGSGIDALTQFAESNRDFEPAGLGLWIREFSIGGTERMLSVKRSRISSFLIQYDVYVPLNSGTGALETAIAGIMEEFDLSDPVKSSVEVDIEGLSVNVKEIKMDGENLKDYRREKLLFTLDVVS